MIQSFKSMCTRKARTAQLVSAATLWQRNYYEHVIRNEASLREIRQYIEANPWNWRQDSYFSD